MALISPGCPFEREVHDALLPLQYPGSLVDLLPPCRPCETAATPEGVEVLALNRMVVHWAQPGRAKLTMAGTTASRALPGRRQGRIGCELHPLLDGRSPILRHNRGAELQAFDLTSCAQLGVNWNS